MWCSLMMVNVGKVSMGGNKSSSLLMRYAVETLILLLNLPFMQAERTMPKRSLRDGFILMARKLS
jgi:hypothetical protein